MSLSRLVKLGTKVSCMVQSPLRHWLTFISRRTGKFEPQYEGLRLERSAAATAMEYSIRHMELILMCSFGKSSVRNMVSLPLGISKTGQRKAVKATGRMYSSTKRTTSISFLELY